MTDKKILREMARWSSHGPLRIQRTKGEGLIVIGMGFYLPAISRAEGKRIIDFINEHRDQSSKAFFASHRTKPFKPGQEAGVC